MAAIVRRGKVVIGVKFDAPPFGSLNQVTNRMEGFDVDIGREIVKALFGPNARLEGPEANVSWVDTISRDRIPFLLDDKVDLVISTMTINEERKQYIDFSDVYYVEGQGLLVKKGSPIRGLADTAGKTVCSAQGSTSEQNLRTRQPQARLLLYGDYSKCLQALTDGLADAISTDDTILLGMEMKDPNLHMVGGLFTEEPYGIGIKKGRPEFVRFINETLAAMKQDGRWKAIYKANLGRLTGLDPEPPR